MIADRQEQTLHDINDISREGNYIIINLKLYDSHQKRKRKRKRNNSNCEQA